MFIFLFFLPDEQEKNLFSFLGVKNRAKLVTYFNT